jgi:hypothetical protein
MEIRTDLASAGGLRQLAQRERNRRTVTRMLALAPALGDQAPFMVAYSNCLGLLQEFSPRCSGFYLMRSFWRSGYRRTEPREGHVQSPR